MVHHGRLCSYLITSSIVFSLQLLTLENLQIFYCCGKSTAVFFQSQIFANDPSFRYVFSVLQFTQCVLLFYCTLLFIQLFRTIAVMNHLYSFDLKTHCLFYPSSIFFSCSYLEYCIFLIDHHTYHTYHTCAVLPVYSRVHVTVCCGVVCVCVCVFACLCVSLCQCFVWVKLEELVNE